MTTLAAVADELYALAPDEFTAARDAAAKRARDSGDRELAEAVKLLRRPSAGAWLVNQLARSHGAELDELLELGETLRAAQDALDGVELRTMSKQRREVVASLSALAQGIAQSGDRKVGDAGQRELEGTLEAALADEAAAQAVRSGRLMRALTSTGLEAVDVDGAVAAPDELPPQSTRRSPARKPVKKPAQKPTPSRAPKPGREATRTGGSAERSEPKRRAAARKADEQALRQAQQQLDGADAELREQESAAQAAREAVKSARARAAQAEAALEQANRDAREADKQRRETEQSHRAAVRARDTARRTVAVARRRADRE